MHIGIIGGIGPAATEFYYRGLIEGLAARGKPLELTIAHADAPTLLDNLAKGDAAAQAALFADLVGRLKGAGAQLAAVTSIAGHFCINELANISPLPLCNLIDAVAAAVAERGPGRIGLMGTRTAMESRLYGVLPASQTVLPQGDDLDHVHQAYVEMATAGRVTAAQREVFFAAGKRLCRDQGADAVMLGGTDLFLAFDGQDCGFETIDCADIHVQALARAAADES